MWNKCQLHHKRSFFCSSMVKSKPAWLCLEKLKFKADVYFCSVNIIANKACCNGAALPNPCCPLSIQSMSKHYLSHTVRSRNTCNKRSNQTSLSSPYLLRFYPNALIDQVCHFINISFKSSACPSCFRILIYVSCMWLLTPQNSTGRIHTGFGRQNSRTFYSFFFFNNFSRT